MTKRNEESNVPAIVSADQLPEFAKHDGPVRGKDNIQQEDLLIPRVKLLQFLSPEVIDDKNELKAGMFVNSLTGGFLGETVDFIALNTAISRIKWVSKEINSGIDCISLDGSTGSRHGDCKKCKFMEWQEGEKGERIAPACNRFMNYPSLLLPELAALVMVSFTRTSTKTGKKLSSLISQRPGDTFLWKYRLSSELIDGEKGKYYIYKIDDAGFFGDDEEAQYRRCEEVFTSLAGKTVAAHDYDQQDEIVADDDEDLPF